MIEDTRPLPDDRTGTGTAPAAPSAPSADNAAPPARPGSRFGGQLAAFQLGQRLASPLGRCAFVGALTLFLLFPLGLVRSIVYERMILHREATDNITDSWGRSQTISGPALIIPYETWQDKKERISVKVNGNDETRAVITREYSLKHKVVLPAAVHCSTEMDPEVRYRGMYRQALYNAPVAVSGAFTLPEARDFGPNVHVVHWDKAYLSIGVTDLKAIAEAPPALWDGVPLASYKPGTDAGALLGAGFHTPVPLTMREAGTGHPFSFTLRVRGSGGIFFTPVGESTTITMTGTWPSPSFQGNLLPVARAVSDQGFSARWVISNLTRTYPQMADLESPEYGVKSRDGSHITNFFAGVTLHEPVTLYRMVRRSVDYGILFIAVTFVALFVFEMVSRQRMHVVQYAMVGISMCVFYLVLLSLAEHVTFGGAFVAASAITIAMNSLYVGAALQSRNKGMVMGGLLAGLYAVLFSLLRMEDFSLLMGTGLVLVMMAALMFVTRKLPQAPAAQAPASGKEKETGTG